MTRNWVTAIVYAAAALAMASQLACYREFWFVVGVSPYAKFAIAGCAVLGFASLLALFELRYGLLLGLAGQSLCWLYYGRLAFDFPWRHAAGVVYTEICGWPEVIAIFGLVAATLCSLFLLRPGRTNDRAFKHLRIVVPVVQMLIFFTFYAFKFFHGVPLEAYRLQKQILALNYPVLTSWVAIALAMEWLQQFLPSLGGWLDRSVETLLIGLFLTSLVLFWYFAADEIELRRQGRSRLRFNGGLQETIAIGVLLLFGVGAFFKAYVTRFDPTPHDRTFPTPFEVAIYQGDFYITRLILVVWGLVFLRLALYDLILFIKSRTHNRVRVSTDK